MDKKIGPLLAISIAFGASGVPAATISEARLQSLLASTVVEDVTLETLRARDRDILRELAASLAARYPDLLAGSELVFTRLDDAGSIFYRLDFVNLRNRDRARALCHILEMERCVARIGSDRLTVLDVSMGNDVVAVAQMEEEPFVIIEDLPRPTPNPAAREVEARVRNTLDPLGTFPEARPDIPADRASSPAGGASSGSERLPAPRAPAREGRTAPSGAAEDEAGEDDPAPALPVPQPPEVDDASDVEQSPETGARTEAAIPPPLVRPETFPSAPATSVRPRPRPEARTPSVAAAGDDGELPLQSSPRTLEAEVADDPDKGPETGGSETARMRDAAPDEGEDIASSSESEAGNEADVVMPATSAGTDEDPASVVEAPDARPQDSRPAAGDSATPRGEDAPAPSGEVADASDVSDTRQTQDESTALTGTSPGSTERMMEMMGTAEPGLATSESPMDEVMDPVEPDVAPVDVDAAPAEPAPAVDMLEELFESGPFEESRAPTGGANTHMSAGPESRTAMRSAVSPEPMSVRIPGIGDIASAGRIDAPRMDAATGTFPDLDPERERSLLEARMARSAPVPEDPSEIVGALDPRSTGLAMMSPRSWSAPDPDPDPVPAAAPSAKEGPGVEAPDTSRVEIARVGESADEEPVPARLEATTSPTDSGVEDASPLTGPIVREAAMRAYSESLPVTVAKPVPPLTVEVSRSRVTARLAPLGAEDMVDETLARVVDATSAPVTQAPPVTATMSDGISGSALRGIASTKARPAAVPAQAVAVSGVEIPLGEQGQGATPVSVADGTEVDEARESHEQIASLIEATQAGEDSDPAVSVERLSERVRMGGRIGTVTFDDSYAAPPSIDLADGEVAGRLQKLPVRRDLAFRDATRRWGGGPIEEPGAGGPVTGNDIAQAPELPVLGPSEEEPARMRARTRLQELLTVEDPAPALPDPDAASGGPEGMSDEIFGEEMPSRPGLPAQTDPSGSPVAEPSEPVSASVSDTPGDAGEQEPPLDRSAGTARRPGLPDLESAPAPDRDVVAQESQPEPSQEPEPASEPSDADRAAEILAEIMRQRQQEARAQSAPDPDPASPAQAPRDPRIVDPADEPAPSARREGASSRSQAAVTHVNPDHRAARDRAAREETLRDDRTRMQRAATPLATPRSSRETLERLGYPSFRDSTAPAPRDLRIELSYVADRDDVAPRVQEIREFIPPMMMRKGQFFAASNPEMSGQYVVGIAANSASDRDDLIWFLDKIGIPWRIR